MRSTPSSGDRKRLVWVSLFMFGLFSLLIVQFFKIQIIEGDRWKKEAQKQHELVVSIPGKRGLFFSNTSIKKGHPQVAQPLVVDILKFHLYADPLSIPPQYREELVQGITEQLELSGPDQDHLREQLMKKSRSRKLVMWISQEAHDKVQEWWSGWARKKKVPRNGLFFIQDYRRSYPFGKLLGQVLHTVREDKEMKTGALIPTGGLEAAFNSHLQGKGGKRFLLRSPRHPLETGQVIKDSADGADLYLTINHTIQAIVEEEIEKAVLKAGAKGGWAVMMEPRTGEILALAQYPFFDPSSYRRYFNDPTLEKETKVKAIIDPFEPGSTMKPLTLAVCLKANEELKAQGRPPLLFPEEKVATTASQFPGRSKVLKDLRHHKFLNMWMGLQKSSNVYMAKMIQRVVETLGEDWYRNTLHELFGLGRKTGIELPGETAGLLPMPGKKHPNGTLEWSKPTPYSLAMGHNVLASSLQMVRSYALIANGGFDVQPTFVRKIVKRNPDGTEQVTVDNTRPERVAGFKRLLASETAQQMVEAMRYTTKPGGSASRADIPGYTSGGKTGTSEKVVGGTYSKKDHISTFIGFAPADKPQFVLAIVIDEPAYRYNPGEGRNQAGGICAAPAFREIGLRTLEYLGVEKDDPDQTVWRDKVKRLQELYKKWNET